MLDESGKAVSGGGYFSKESKCCTHYPELPNYLIGALLSNISPGLETGRSRIRRTIQSRIGVTPHGILRPRKFGLLLINSDKMFFGRSRRLICPFYERTKGICTIRPFWDAACNSWFCKYSAGEDGRIFWTALKRYMNEAEKTLVQYALQKMRWDPQKIIRLESSDGLLSLREVDDQPPDPKTYRDLWGDWAGHEENFYEETFRIVSALAPKSFEKISGIVQKILLEEVKMRWRDLLKPKLAEFLKRNPDLHVDKKGDDNYYLVGYSTLDPFMVSKRVYDLLDFFDGRRTLWEACRLIQQHLGAAPDEELVTKLYHYRILQDTK